MKPSREIRNVVLGFYHDIANADPSAVDLISASPDVILIGSDPEEHLVGPQVAQLFRAQMRATGRTDITPGWLTAFEEGSVGWASDTPTWTLRDGTRVLVRFTMVFHREPVEWKLVQFHASVGVANAEAMGEETTSNFNSLMEVVAQERPDMSETMSPEGTVTIMFTDIEGSTAHNEELGDDVFVPLLLRHDEIVRTHTASGGGAVVKAQGDGFMLAFSSARRAVACAIAVQRDVAELDNRLRVRMGLHTGEPVRHVDDFFGRDVAYAARLGAAAVGGEILVSSLVKSLVAPSGTIGFDGPRALDLKGFDGAQDAYSVQWSV